MKRIEEDNREIKNNIADILQSPQIKTAVTDLGQTVEKIATLSLHLIAPVDKLALNAMKWDTLPENALISKINHHTKGTDHHHLPR